MTLEKSARWFEENKKFLAGGVSSDVRKAELPHPLYFESGSGSRIRDVDGNEYIDYVLGQGPLLLGHSPRPVLEAVHRQLDRGLVFAGQHQAEAELARLLTRAIPCAERVRFNSTGSEAVITALRAARAYRGRNLVVKFEGQWHGWYDSLFVSTAPGPDQQGDRSSPNPVLPSKGQVANAADNLVIMPWNDLELLEDLFARRGSEIAAILTEPVMCNSGSLMPRPGFLEGLRSLCDRYESVLIFDEVITGFRLALGGAQEIFGVTPDLATYAKGIASGFTLSAVVGKAEVMDLISSGQVVHAGTYNSNPVVIAAGLATLQTLTGDREAVYAHLNRLGGRLRDGLAERLQRAEVPALVGGLGTGGAGQPHRPGSPQRLPRMGHTGRPHLPADGHRPGFQGDPHHRPRHLVRLHRPHRRRRGPDAGCFWAGSARAQRGIGLLIRRLAESRALLRRGDAVRKDTTQPLPAQLSLARVVTHGTPRWPPTGSTADCAVSPTPPQGGSDIRASYAGPSITPPLRGSRRSPSRMAKASAVGGSHKASQRRDLVRRRGFAQANLQAKADAVGGDSGQEILHPIQNLPSSLRKSTGRSVFPSRARSARTSPNTGANLNPWPEKPAPNSTCSYRGWRSMMNWPSGVKV